MGEKVACFGCCHAHSSGCVLGQEAALACLADEVADGGSRVVVAGGCEPFPDRDGGRPASFSARLFVDDRSAGEQPIVALPALGAVALLGESLERFGGRDRAGGLEACRSAAPGFTVRKSRAGTPPGGMFAELPLQLPYSRGDFLLRSEMHQRAPAPGVVDPLPFGLGFLREEAHLGDDQLAGLLGQSECGGPLAEVDLEPGGSFAGWLLEPFPPSVPIPLEPVRLPPAEDLVPLPRVSPCLLPSVVTWVARTAHVTHSM